MLWIAFKIALSAVLLTLIAFALISTTREPAAALGFVSTLLILVASLWIVWKNPNRAIALIGIAIGIGSALYGFHILDGGVKLPQACTGHKRLLCLFQNGLYAFGGRLLVSAPYVFGALALVIGCIRFLAKRPSALS